MVIHKIIIEDFIQKNNLQYLNICCSLAIDHFDFINFESHTDSNYSISDFNKLALIGEGSNGKVIPI